MRNTDNYNNKEIGKRLKEARKSIGRTLKQMSQISGLSISTIHGMEMGNNKPNIKYLYLLSEEFNINLNWIVTGTGSMLAPGFDLTWKFGEDSKRILELIYMLEHCDILRYEILGRYSEFRESHRELLESILSRRKKD